MISLREGAMATGKAKATILKAIKTGRLSASKTVKGEWEIDPAELFRVYPAAVTDLKKQGGDPVSDYQVRIKELEAKISAKVKEVELLQKSADSWETMAHSWRSQTETVTKLLTHDKTPGILDRIFR